MTEIPLAFVGATTDEDGGQVLHYEFDEKKAIHDRAEELRRKYGRFNSSIKYAMITLVPEDYEMEEEA